MTADNILLDLPAFLRTLRAERRSAMLIHGAPLCGKSRFARQLADKVDGGYLNVLDTLSHRPDLSAQIDQFDPSTLRGLVLESVKSAPKDVILVDELDFLFPIWGTNLKPFQDILYDLYNPQRGTAFVFFAQTRPEWETWQLETASRQNRIILFENLKPL